MLCSDTWEPMAKRLFSCFSTREIISWSSCEVKPSTPEEEKNTYIYLTYRKQTKTKQNFPCILRRMFQTNTTIQSPYHHELPNSKMCLFSLHINTVKVKVQLLRKVRHSLLYHPDDSRKRNSAKNFCSPVVLWPTLLIVKLGTTYEPSLQINKGWFFLLK